MSAFIWIPFLFVMKNQTDLHKFGETFSFFSTFLREVILWTVGLKCVNSLDSVLFNLIFNNALRTNQIANNCSILGHLCRESQHFNYFLISTFFQQVLLFRGVLLLVQFPFSDKCSYSGRCSY